MHLYNRGKVQNIEQLNMPRLGLINYINSLPIVLPIMQGLVKVDAQLILAEPTRLNALFAANEVEYGAMSAFAYLEQNNLALIPTVSISSQGAVSSVLLFSKMPIEKQALLKVAVPTGSATSVNALLLLLAENQKEMPVLITVGKPSLDDPELDAALVIGDRALLIDEEWSKIYHRYDLGQWWYESFNLPMVFGVFAVRTNWLPGGQNNKLVNENNEEQNQNPSMSPLIEQLGEVFLEASRIGLGLRFESVLEEAERRTGLSKERLKQYYKNDLDFSWTAKHSQALEKYAIL